MTVHLRHNGFDGVMPSVADKRQLMQAKLFENQDTRNGVRKYAASVHYHYVSESATSAETQDGARMVQSTITEMLANVSQRLLLLSCR